MSERTGYPHGTFCWTDLGTTEAASAKEFYLAVFGWDYEDQPTDSGDYTMFSKNGKPVCALYEQGPERLAAGWSPTWLSYVSVDDADAIAQQASDLGAEIVSDPFDVMDAGRMSLLADPHGAMFAIWQPGNHFGAGLVNDPGSMTWNELATSDVDGAVEFYTQLFGWGVKSRSDDETGYTVVQVGDRTNGGIRKISPRQDSGPDWLVYFTTDSLDRDAETADDRGGNVLVAPMTIPVSTGESRLAIVQDPQGAVFALYEGEIDD